MQPKLLLVDDREDNLLSIASILEPEGYLFSKASSGRQALKILLNEYDFALILMDVKMPELSGFETAALIYEREKLRHIPIIFITAHSYSDENIFRGYKTGAVDYIYKPINPVLLKAKVSVFVELYRKNHILLAQEQKLITINKNLEMEIKEQKNSEKKIKTLNRQLIETIDRLEAANKELDRIAFMASHDLQEPLRKIRMFSDKLYSKYTNVLDEEGKTCIDRIQHAGERMQALIKDILTFSSISVEKDTYQSSNLNTILNDVLKDYETTLINMQAIVQADHLPFLDVNPGLIRSLFSNLIGNAIKYRRNEVVPVIKIYSEISTFKEVDANELAGNKYCRIYFEDNGIGFDQKYAEQIFGMFKRLHSNREFEGTGIGLALCKKIVEDHKGFIYAKSKVNVGSTFIVSLPISTQKKESNQAVKSA